MYNEKLEKDFLTILSEELVPAMGCTEPIALAYASAKAAEILGTVPEKIIAKCSGNIVKNVRCVSIPNSNGMLGTEAAVTLGALGGDSSLNMEVLESVTDSAIADTHKFIESGKCQIEFLDSEIPLHFVIIASANNDSVSVEVKYSHTNVVRIEKNGQILFDADSDRKSVV